VARLLEQHAKAFLRDRGLAVPRGEEASSPREAEAVARRLGGRVAVKALVPANRRARDGGVRFADDPAAAARTAEALLGSTVSGFEVRSLLVEEALHVERELFFALVLDKERQVPVALASARGGVDVEDRLARRSDELRTLALDPGSRPLPFRLRELWAAAGLSGADLLRTSALCHGAAGAFFDADLTLLELNPVALAARDEGPTAVAVGVVLEVDDAALARQPALAAVARTGLAHAEPTELEAEALRVAAFEPHRGTARFRQLDGDIGLLCGGGGSSLVLFEAIRRAGGRPACLTELGGNPSAEKVRRLAHVVLSCPGLNGLLVGHNLTSNTQVDLVARGVVAALEERGLDPREFPVVAREVGTHDAEGREILERAGIEYLGEGSTLEDAAVRIVERVGEAGR
jgi:succinyl-CoA synthetase beta subunit